MSFGLISHRIRFQTPPPLPLPNKSGYIFPDTDFFFFFLTRSPRIPLKQPGTPPPEPGLHLSLLCSAWGFPETLAPANIPPLEARGGKPGERGG